MAKRPEHSGPPELYYDEEEAKKYSSNSRTIEIQTDMAERALELLALPPNRPCFILDVGCGSGLSGSVLEEAGHAWAGIDISKAMLKVATEREVEGDLVLGDMGQGVPFRPGTFDGAISISAVQWLCTTDKVTGSPYKRLFTFFSALYACLHRTARAVFQFYPENQEQIELIANQAIRAGFHGGLVIDYPNSAKAKKYYLVLLSGGVITELPQALGTDDVARRVTHTKRREVAKAAKAKPIKKSKEWILEKKERRRRQGKDTKPDTKYTGRKRSGRT